MLKELTAIFPKLHHPQNPVFVPCQGMAQNNKADFAEPASIQSH
jgi:hypothetical protein